MTREFFAFRVYAGSLNSRPVCGDDELNPFLHHRHHTHRMSDILDEMGFKLWLLLLDHVKGMRIEILSDLALLHLCINFCLYLSHEHVTFILLRGSIDDIYLS